MNRPTAFLIQILAVDIATFLTFAIVHWFVIAPTWGPLMGLPIGILPAAFVVVAYHLWQRAGHVDGVWLGLGAGLCGALPWLLVFKLGWGAAADGGLPFAWYMVYATGIAGLLALIATLVCKRHIVTALASFGAVVVAFGLPAAFLISQPIGWVNVRALAALVVSYTVAGSALEWTERLITQRDEARVRPTAS